MEPIGSTERISAIIDSEKHLEAVITELISASIARSDINVQGNSAQIKDKYGVAYINPFLVQNSTNPPVHEPFLNDDFGWVVSFSFAIPVFICLILGIFVIGDIRSTYDNLLYGLMGLAAGTIIGSITASSVKKCHQHKLQKQEQQGGFVIWIIIHNLQQQQQALKILKKYSPGTINLNANNS